jgi:uncharacterized protein (TIGR02145 family)
MKKIIYFLFYIILIFISEGCEKDLTYGTVTDSEGNVYKTIAIGTKTWMAENLKSIKFIDGTPIPLVTDNKVWASISSPCYCWNNNDPDNYRDIYGALYNWSAVNTGKLCPFGWHVSTQDEWEELAQYHGDYKVAGGKLKEKGTTHWRSPNTGSTNEKGFTALPGGGRGFDGAFYAIGESANWWSATQYDSVFAHKTTVVYNRSEIFTYYIYPKVFGFSVRCVKN